MSQRIILSSQEIQRALKRIAHEILEANEGSSDLILLGIPTRGIALASRLTQMLKEIEPGYQGEVGTLDITMYRDDLSKKEREIKATSLPKSGITDKVVILVDDVLFSGRTIRAALDALVDFGRPRQVKLAALIDRGHRELPIRPDFVGKNIPTAKTERVTVLLAEHDGIDQVVIG
jgi:pyrimidine operon attenuation protein/uracil phosphoribosyltransferase